MGRQNAAIVTFNRGRISPRSLARADMQVLGAVERVALSSEIQTNWLTGIFGSMMLRPGMEHKGSTYQDKRAVFLNFIFSLADQADIELTDNVMRVWIDDTVISRPSVATTITNGNFATDLTGWTDADEGGAVSQWVTGSFMGLTGISGNAAIRTQQVTVGGADQGIEHGVRVKIARGEAKIKIGSTAGDDDYVGETTLRAGEFSFGFIPAGNYHIEISSTTEYQTLVESITHEAAGDMLIPTIWGEASLRFVRYDQSGDVLFVACKDKRQYRIERRAARSWGVSEYLAEDGPFQLPNITPITIQASAISGDITLTASKSIFRPSNVGGLYRLTSTGQTVSSSIAAQNIFTNPIRVTGVGASRTFTVNISGTWSATVTLQRSIGEVGNWEDTGTTYTANTVTTFSDGLDNQIVFYRLGIKTGNYTSGTAVCSLVYSLGTSFGIARVTGFTSGTSVSAVVLKPLGGTSATTEWDEGTWSDRRGYPSSVTFDEGRLWWAGKDKIFGSVTDAFDSFDDNVEGDSGPVIRTLGSGSVDNINWLLPIARLVIGAETGEKVVRSSSLDEPLSPTLFNIRTPSTRGSSPVAPVKIDSNGIFVRSNRLFQMEYYAETLDYQATDATMLVPEIGGNGFVKIAVQRYPDTRVHCVKEDGTAAIWAFDRQENVKCWVDFETDGVIEDVFVRPARENEIEDVVYYIVRRTINGVTKRYKEAWAFEADCVGGVQNKQADCFVAGTQSPLSTITGLDHLEGRDVIVWADGKCLSKRDGGFLTRIVNEETNTLVAAFTVQPDLTRVLQIDRTISALKDAGIWQELDALWVMAAHDSQAGLINWIDPTALNLTAFNSPTFTADAGYQGNGTDAYLTPSVNWNSLTKLQQDSATMFTWINGGTDAQATAYSMGQTTGSSRNAIQPRAATTGNLRCLVNMSTNVNLGVQSTVMGLSHANRSGATAIQGYKDGVQTGTSTEASVSAAANFITLLRFGSSYADYRLAVAGVGASLTAQQASDLYDILGEYLNGVVVSANEIGGQILYKVENGQITLPVAVQSYVVGLPYKARYKSVRLAYAANGGTALLQKGRIDHIGVIARNMHNRSLRYGATDDRMYELPLVERGEAVDEDYIWDEYSEETFEFEPEFDTDSRVHLEALAPMPCELLGLVFTMEKNEKV